MDGGHHAGGYLGDLRRAVAASDSRLGVYGRRGGAMAAVISDSSSAVPPERLGEHAEQKLLVLFSADRGIIVSGYQFPEMSKVAIPEDALWLR